MKNITVIGAGAWGTALASIFAKAGANVVMWAFEKEIVTSIAESGENSLYLPNISLPTTIKVTNNIDESIANAQIIVVSTPTQFTRSTLAQIAGKLPESIPIIIASKGIEIKSGSLLSTVINDIFPNNPTGVLTGPTFAVEAAKELPTAITLAIEKQYQTIGQEVVDAIAYKTFRPYLSFDPIGAQVGGAIKNVIAIACGVSSGLGLGDNARAALITRGLAEITRLGIALGGQKETFSGLSGLGDLTLTCSAMQSRNFSLGYRIGQGEDPASILASRSSVSEGAYTAEAAVAMSEKFKIEMPICHSINSLMRGTITAQEVFFSLMHRPLKHEYN